MRPEHYERAQPQQQHQQQPHHGRRKVTPASTSTSNPGVADSARRPSLAAPPQVAVDIPQNTELGLERQARLAEQLETQYWLQKRTYALYLAMRQTGFYVSSPADPAEELYLASKGILIDGPADDFEEAAASYPQMKRRLSFHRHASKLSEEEGILFELEMEA